jgi:hypothetical protein
MYDVAHTERVGIFLCKVSRQRSRLIDTTERFECVWKRRPIVDDTTDIFSSLIQNNVDTTYSSLSGVVIIIVVEFFGAGRKDDVHF